MNITPLSPLMQQALMATLSRAEDGFAATTAVADVPGASAHAAAPPPAVAPPTTSIQMLVALAAAEPTMERRRRMAATADRGLSLLERLQAELAIGTPTVERLEELADWAEHAEAAADPQIATLQRDVELRVRVELAKLDLKV